MILEMYMIFIKIDLIKLLFFNKKFLFAKKVQKILKIEELRNEKFFYFFK